MDIKYETKKKLLHVICDCPFCNSRLTGFTIDYTIDGKEIRSCPKCFKTIEIEAGIVK
jgi:Zn-finger protein